MKVLLVALCAVLLAAQPPKPVVAKTTAPVAGQAAVPRAAIEAVEKNIDRRIRMVNTDDPLLLLGNTRGIYLGGYGVVLTSEVNLVNSPGISPFHQTITPDERTRLHIKKLQRLEKLKEAMKAMLIAAGSDLRSVPSNENIVLGMTLFYFYWEDTTGLPSQIVMQASRQQLMNHQELGFIRSQEF